MCCIVIVVTILILIVMKREMSVHYLNYNSTDPSVRPVGHKYNPSDIYYSESQSMRLAQRDAEKYAREVFGAPFVPGNVIVNSGSTESIATIINWAKSVNPNGVILGSSFDHPSVRLNAENQGMVYEEINFDDFTLPINTAALIITHVKSSTGEIYPINKIISEFNKYSFLNERDYIADSPYTHEDPQYVRQYKPIIAIDAAQSVGKLPINMMKLGVNATFFSMHKLGNEFGSGIMILNDTVSAPYKPLIAGYQQNEMRGGTYNAYSIIDFKQAYKKSLKRDDLEQTWLTAKNKFELAGYEVYEPKFEHLYNTLYVRVNSNTCADSVIQHLAQRKLYAGNTSSCMNERNAYVEFDSEEIGEEHKWIRFSFKNNDDLTPRIVDKIIKALDEIHD